MQIGTGGQRSSAIPTVVAVCRTELDRAFNAWRAANPTVVHDARTMGPHPSEACRLPHEHGAAIVLTIWGHLHPIESRAIECATKLVAQRKAGWADRTAATLTDLRWYLAERVKLRAAFDAAATDYIVARAAADMPIAA